VGARAARLVWLLIGLAGVACASAASAAAACPNEAFRLGPSALLPECRAYEMVSPVDKNGGNIKENVVVRTNPSGDAAAFYSTASFAEAEGNPMFSAYIARRGDADWATESVDAPQFNPAGLLVKTSPANSVELDKTLQYSKVALTPGASEGGSNVYIRDNLTGKLTLVATEPGGQLFQSLTGIVLTGYIDGTDDFSHVLFSARGQVLPEAAPNTENLYEFAEGELRLVNWMEDETVDPSGAHVTTRELPYANTMTPDGSRIFFNTGTFFDSPLYMREDGTDTVAISVSQKAGEAGELRNGTFAAATADSSVVFFTSPSDLSDEPGPFGLYRYEIESGELTDLLSGATGPETVAGQLEVLDISADGSHVYFTTPAALTEGSTEAPFGGNNVYVWHDGQIRLIAALPVSANEFRGPRQRLADPSGRYLAFASFAQLDEAEDPLSPNCPQSFSTGNEEGMCRDVFLYDYVADELTCVTCTSLPARGHSNLGNQEFHEKGMGDEYPRSVLSDGTVFVDTPNRLLARDLNNVGDAYEWQAGEYGLLSTGTSSSPSNFGDSTADGSVVFIRTTEQLVPQDVDANIDVYAVRENGGLTAQHPPAEPEPCLGDECRGPAPVAAEPPVPASGSPRANSNLPAGCAALSRRARAAESKADRLRRKARGATGKSLRQLRKQASKQQKKANRLNAKARNCGGQG
jgi:hypothetical protein